MVAIVKLRHRVIELFDTETEYVFYACDNLRSGSIFVPVGKYNSSLKGLTRREPQFWGDKVWLILGYAILGEPPGAVGRDDRMFVVKFTLESRRVSSIYNS